MSKEAKQPAQQEPVAWMYQCRADNSGPVLMQHKQDWAKSGSGLWTEAPLYTSPPAQPVKWSDHESDGMHHNKPAVPDAFGTREGEHPQYVQGWNDCRAETLKMRKP